MLNGYEVFLFYPYRNYRAAILLREEQAPPLQLQPQIFTKTKRKCIEIRYISSNFVPNRTRRMRGLFFCWLIIGPFADDVAGAGFGFHINFSYIFPDNAEGKQLCATEKADDGND